MEIDKLKELYVKYGLSASDVYSHQHYKIITRQGIDKIQATEKIAINYDVIECRPDFAVVKATASTKAVNSDGVIETLHIQSFGSAYKGATYKEGNTNSWYVMEMAEKRAMSRVVLKLTGFYELGVFGEDESEDFKRTKEIARPNTTSKL